MNRSIMGPAAVVLGGLAVVTALVALVIAALADRGLVSVDPGWVVPLVGGSVGLLSWFLLTGTSNEDEVDVGRTNVSCSSCGTDVREDWRLCPYCGSSTESSRSNEAAERVPTQVVS